MTEASVTFSGMNLHGFLGFDGLVQAFGQAAAIHHTTGEFVDQHHLTVADDVILVLLEQLVRAQTLVDMVHNRRAFGIIKRRARVHQAAGNQLGLEELVALVGKGDIAGFLVELVMVILEQRNDLASMLL